MKWIVEFVVGMYEWKKWKKICLHEVMNDVICWICCLYQWMYEVIVEYIVCKNEWSERRYDFVMGCWALPYAIRSGGVPIHRSVPTLHIQKTASRGWEMAMSIVHIGLTIARIDFLVPSHHDECLGDVVLFRDFLWNEASFMRFVLLLV